MTGPHTRREIYMARRELGNAERLLTEAMSKLELVKTLLDKAIKNTGD